MLLLLNLWANPPLSQGRWLRWLLQLQSSLLCGTLFYTLQERAYWTRYGTDQGLVLSKGYKDLRVRRTAGFKGPQDSKDRRVQRTAGFKGPQGSKDCRVQRTAGFKGQSPCWVWAALGLSRIVSLVVLYSLVHDQLSCTNASKTFSNSIKFDNFYKIWQSTPESI